MTFERVTPGGQFSAANVNAQTDALELLTTGGGRPGYYGPNGERAEMPSTGGGGSTIARYRITAISADYLTCEAWDGATAGATVIVAKDPAIRSTVTSYTASGETWNCTYDAGATTRTATGATTGIVEIQKLNEPYAVGQEVFAAEVIGNTGVSVSGSEVSMIVINTPHWVRQQI